MKQRTLTALSMFAAVLAFAACAGAQDITVTNSSQNGEPATVRFSKDPVIVADKMMAEARFGLAGKIVKNQPYSAVATTESTQILGDGTHIHNQSSYTIYRDAEGRVRRETPNEIWISDPVANESYVLIPAKQIARKMPLMRSFINDHIAARIPAGALDKEKMEKDQAEAGAGPFIFTNTAPRGEGENVAFARTSGFIAGANAQEGPGMVTITIDQNGDGPGTIRHHEFAGRADSQEQNENLGAQAFEGVQAKGVRHLVTVPIGQIGNDRPIQYTTERWFSPELQVTIMTKNSDPVNGDIVFQLTNIRRGAPDPSLFQVPGSYQVVPEQETRPMKRPMD
jgi:hypothetical protein